MINAGMYGENMFPFDKCTDRIKFKYYFISMQRQNYMHLNIFSLIFIIKLCLY